QATCLTIAPVRFAPTPSTNRNLASRTGHNRLEETGSCHPDASPQVATKEASRTDITERIAHVRSISSASVAAASVLRQAAVVGTPRLAVPTVRVSVAVSDSVKTMLSSGAL